MTRQRAGTVELRHHGVRAAGIVADHAAKGIAIVRSGIRPEGEAIPARLCPQVVENASRLDAGDAPHRVDLQDAIEIPGVVDDHRDIASLPGE